jgi:TRAP-type C4-dicarboxylate transport system permease small subunit
VSASQEGAGHGIPLATAVRRFRAVYGHILEWVVGTMMIVLFVEVTLGIVFRAVGQSLAWYDEVASHLLAWLTFYGAALASVRRAHIGCPELVDILPWPIRRRVNIGAQLVVIAFFVLLGGVGASILPILASDSLVSLPWVSVAIVQSVIPVSAALIVIAESAHLIDLVIATAPPPEASAGVALADGLH